MAAGVQQFLARPHDELERRSSSPVLPSSPIWQVRTRNLGRWGVPREKKSAVPQPSTDRALRRLTSEFGRDPVYLLWYSRWRQPQTFVSQTFMLSGTTCRARRACTLLRTERARQCAHRARTQSVSAYADCVRSVCAQSTHAERARRVKGDEKSAAVARRSPGLVPTGPYTG